MDRQDLLRAEYDQVAQRLSALTDERFRLLAFVPTIAGAAVGLISGRPPAVELLAIGVLGLSATLGILVYELHNSQVASDLARQADRLERALAFGGSVLAERAGETRRLFGVVRLSRGRALALVYAPALGGWSYLCAWGFLRAAHAAHARTWGLCVGGVIALLVFLDVERLEHGEADPRGDASP